MGNEWGIKMVVKITKKENILQVSFKYSPEKIAKIKTIKGYKWNPDKKMYLSSEKYPTF
jgi:hypothetical protein